MNHYQQKSHKKNMLDNGVQSLIKSIPPPTTSAPSSSTTLPENRLEVDDAEDEHKVSYKDFIVLDEVGETDDVDFEEISSSTPNGGLLDELDVVSDDDDLLCGAANKDQENGGSRIHDRDKADSDSAAKTDLRLPEADLISESSDDNFSIDDDDADLDALASSV